MQNLKIPNTCTSRFSDSLYRARSTGEKTQILRSNVLLIFMFQQLKLCLIALLKGGGGHIKQIVNK